jgi:hypothetical protein
MADQEGTARRVFGMAGLTMTAESDAAIKSYLESHRRDRHGQLEYDIQEDFGLDIPSLRKRFAFYTERFGLSD